MTAGRFRGMPLAALQTACRTVAGCAFPGRCLLARQATSAGAPQQPTKQQPANQLLCASPTYHVQVRRAAPRRLRRGPGARGHAVLRPGQHPQDQHVPPVRAQMGVWVGSSCECTRLTACACSDRTLECCRTALHRCICHCSRRLMPQRLLHYPCSDPKRLEP